MTVPADLAEAFPQSYTGRPWDGDIELYQNRARWYDPVMGRFISVDPSGFDGGDANLYRYCNNSAINYNDPSGLCYTGSFDVNSITIADYSRYNNVTTYGDIYNLSTSISDPFDPDPSPLYNPIVSTVLSQMNELNNTYGSDTFGNLMSSYSILGNGSQPGKIAGQIAASTSIYDNSGLELMTHALDTYTGFLGSAMSYDPAADFLAQRYAEIEQFNSLPKSEDFGQAQTPAKLPSWYGYATGAATVGQKLLAPIRWTGLTDAIGVESYLQQCDAGLAFGCDQHFGESGSDLRTAMNISANTGVYSLYAAGGLTTASGLGITEVGTVPGSLMLSQAKLELTVFAVTGSATPAAVLRGGAGTWAQALTRGADQTTRRGYLNDKFGRIGNLHADINERGSLEAFMSPENASGGSKLFLSSPQVTKPVATPNQLLDMMAKRKNVDAAYSAGDHLKMQRALNIHGSYYKHENGITDIITALSYNLVF